MEFNRNFETIIGETLTLKLIETCDGDDQVIPFYYYAIYLNSISSTIGKISIRIGHNEHAYINGNIGYEIDEPFRGNGYARMAVMMTYPIARYHGMTHLIISCDDYWGDHRLIDDADDQKPGICGGVYLGLFWHLYETPSTNGHLFTTNL